MKKLPCISYLNRATTREQLVKYAGHLLKRHLRDSEIALPELAASRSFNRRTYSEVNRLAQQAERDYNSQKRGQL